MEEEVLRFIEKHQLLKKGKRVLIGVSGGPDSMALLHLFTSICDRLDLKVMAISVDHQLRGEDSKKDVQYVQEICNKWGVPFVAEVVDVSGYAKHHKTSEELAAREVRYAAYERIMRKYSIDYLALGHHADDQVETVLMGLTRSSNPQALQGIPVCRPFAMGMIIRPLLSVTRTEIEDYCNSVGITPRIDKTNDDVRYTRNYFRKRIIPLLKQKNPNIHTTIGKLSGALQEDAAYMLDMARHLVEKEVYIDSKAKKAEFKITTFLSHPIALQRRSFHLILNYLYDTLPKDLSYIHEECFFSLINSGKANVHIDFPQYLRIEKSYGTLIFYFQEKPLQKPFPSMKLDIPGVVTLPDGSRIISSYVKTPKMQGLNIYLCELESMDLPLHIRTRENGDRMSWNGLNGSKKIKDIFIDAKIPLNKRDTWPLITDNNGEIVWLVGLKKGQPRNQHTENESADSYIQLLFEKDTH